MWIKHRTLGAAVALLLLAGSAPAMVVSGRGLAEVYVDLRDAPELKPGDRLAGR